MQQAFYAMVLFLEKQFESTQDDGIAMLLGDLRILPEGITADPAAWSEWKEAVQTVLNSQPSDKPKLPDAS